MSCIYVCIVSMVTVDGLSTIIQVILMAVCVLCVCVYVRTCVCISVCVCAHMCLHETSKFIWVQAMIIEVAVKGGLNIPHLCYPSIVVMVHMIIGLHHTQLCLLQETCCQYHHFGFIMLRH